MLLNFEHINKSYGDRQILSDVTFYLKPGDHMGVVGVNGCGKSTLLRIAAGEERPDAGRVSTDPNVRIGWLSQDLRDDPAKTVLDQVLSSQSPDAREIARYEAFAMLTKLGITEYNKQMGELSGGQRKRVALVQCLLSPSDVLILDEPTNHLDTGMIRWLEEYLDVFSGAVLFVTHDRYFLERIATQTAEVSFGRFFLYDGAYSSYLDGKARREESEAASERKRQSVLRRELAWVLQGPCARGTKSRERLQRYEELRRRQPPQVEKEVGEIRAVSSRLGRKTIELSAVSKQYGSIPVIRSFDFLLMRDDRVGIVGPNGSGKSTLLGLMSGRLSPDSGTVSIGETVKTGYFSQHGQELDGRMRAIDYVREHGDRIETQDGCLTASRLMELFLFSGDLQHRQIARLSGGEKRRLLLLGILASAPNILMLDEPTNDLDIPTLQVLEDYLETFPGAVIAVSHDRYFLDRICRRLFTIGPDHRVNEYIGSFSDYLDESSRMEKQSRLEKQAKPESAEKTVSHQKKLRFSFREQREFENIDDEIAALERMLAENHAEQEACATDYVRLQILMEEQTQLEAQLEEKTDRWVYLNELAERIAAQQS
ncbi:MAG: ABC-F family ATP-binding cassette domain-containing protein [Oscillospiraceae bacterium]|nr:ABC-F family ATP-binding cassette domain-containing protein [Oscillospiraceae bacterium]